MLYGLPGQGRDDPPPLLGQLADGGGVQGAVGLAQGAAQFQEAPALLRLGAQQQVRGPGREGRAAGGADPAGVVGPAVRLRGERQLGAAGDEGGRGCAVQLVERRLDLRPAPVVPPGAAGGLDPVGVRRTARVPRGTLAPRAAPP
ncbi:hypothetical protein [Streptomyces griseosporeus]|uniref:hypothetical protein n=1 Tax=Streptomyces griseosporeus TaxID=1910 RepID=UPI0036F73958